MYKETYKIIVVLLLTVATAPEVFGQAFLSISGFGDSRFGDSSAPGTHIVSSRESFAFSSWRNNQAAKPASEATSFFRLQPGIFTPAATARSEKFPSASAVDRDLYIKGFGFFCRKELQVEKATRLPLRLRLGSLEQCNILEQKN